MKNVIWIISLLLYSGCTFQDGSKSEEGKKYADFNLTYFSVGLGANMGSMQPTFRVTGREFIYTNEQNSFYAKPINPPETVCVGNLRTASIDSILDIAKAIKDTLVYNANPSIMSGGFHTISIGCKDIDLRFHLHNASDPAAEKIVDILNSNLAPEIDRLWLFSDFSQDTIQNHK